MAVRRGRLRARNAAWWLRAALSVLAALWTLAAAPAHAGEPPAAAAPASAAATAARVLRVFVREGCPHCADAKVFLHQLQARRPDLHVQLRPVDVDASALEELVAVSRRAGSWPPGVPTFEIDGRVLVGFHDDERARRALLGLIDGHRAPAAQVESRLFGRLSAGELGLPLFTLALGLLDGFNPCAMWVLLFLLSLLLRLNDRRRMALVAGTFVVVSGLVYYAFMAAWLNIFLAVGLSQPVRIGLALLALIIGAVNVKDFFAFGHGPSLSIPAGARPGLVARMQRIRRAQALPAMLAGVVVLAVVVNFVELLCTAGLPALYTAVLAQRALTPAGHYAYLALYIVAYMADDALMVALAVAALGSGKLTERGGRVLKLLSGVVMLALGAVLLVRPQWLA